MPVIFFLLIIYITRQAFLRQFSHKIFCPVFFHMSLNTYETMSPHTTCIISIKSFILNLYFYFHLDLAFMICLLPHPNWCYCDLGWTLKWCGNRWSSFFDSISNFLPRWSLGEHWSLSSKHLLQITIRWSSAYWFIVSLSRLSASWDQGHASSFHRLLAQGPCRE